MRIGDHVYADCGTHTIDGVIIAGWRYDTGEFDSAIGAEIDLDSELKIRADDDGKPYRINGWLWTFEPSAA